ncbi:MAG: hypothetical protein OXI90_08755 [Gammaproteobacteria bacterium]|nr:hypothetical protein [Gammaproteobacteria bacterium]
MQVCVPNSIISDEAAEIARAGGLYVVMDRCFNRAPRRTGSPGASPDRFSRAPCPRLSLRAVSLRPVAP